MSRIGKKNILIKENVNIFLEKQKIMIKGPKGVLNHTLPEEIEVINHNTFLSIKIKNNNKKSKQLYGLSRTLLNNMMLGVVEGFTKKLIINGVGYKAQINNQNLLVLNLGYSHNVIIKPPKDIKINVSENIILIQGISKEKVGQIAAEIRSIRPPEPYKGKGIKYEHEIIRKKVGKAGK